HRDQRTVFPVENQRAQRFENRVVRFLSAETLYALAPCQPQIRTTSGLLLEHVNERRLADARLSRYEDHLPLAAQRLFKMLIELRERRVAAHHVPGIARSALRQGRCHVGDLRYKLIAPLR